jgi:AhpD family alkylhydroperoxidase
MQARTKNPAMIIPEAMQAIQALGASFHNKGVPEETLALVHLRASQINGCSPCVDSGARQMRKNGETDERLFSAAAWRETPYYTEPERAALNLTEHATRLADRSDPVPDEVWDQAAKHFDEKQLSAIVLWIATTNFFNRINAATKTPAPQNWG